MAQSILFSVDQIKKQLQAPLPGKSIQMMMAPEARENWPEAKDPIQSAILILLYPKSDQLHTVFIKRPEYPGIHSGQISFPGGRYETIDKTMMDTAIREAAEEIGVPANEITIWGQLTQLYIPVSNYIVYPYVGYLPYHPSWIIDPVEVSFIIEASLEALSNPSIRKNEQWSFHNISRNVPFFAVQGHKIWGATAMILNEFLAIAGKNR